ncbi:fimbria/pilus periplasmic chaperone [Aeromonas piscicola]|uniref:fimbria/pilus periplasmic chaperone n=1 Tax=Aeromonas piscicola TaxID=600645 RepID=UPI0021F8DC73|nr:fimbria/pilus periplasmic chaperone [Aeromonas piscicola]MCW0507632.1 fimbria/pilus periplasmic chaperone [Aeromonas piscicola]
MKKVFKVTMLIISILSTSYVDAAISLDRTRVIFPGDRSAVSLKIANQNKELPFLAQAWLEDDTGKKISSPFIVLPPIQRLEPEMASILKIQSLPAVAQLPQDKESLFYFNLREVPPKSEQSNTLQLALQTKIKFFYRPQALVVADGSTKALWQEKLTLNLEGSGYYLDNPTPYYVTVVSAATSEKETPISGFEAVMLSPNSSHKLNLAGKSLGSTPTLTYVDDYGGRRLLNYKCSTSCQLVSAK